MSLVLGLAAPLGYELLLNRRLRCRDDLERHFGIPVLAQFGPLPSPIG
jgi:succinoglycan biosynthesis transport protein ExoP